MKKNKWRKAFTLVELLAVIVILAVILVIAIPQIMNVIKAARLSSIKDSAMLIAEQAEKDFIAQQVLNKDYNSISIPCTDVAKLNDDYDSCSITYNNGVATVTLKGKDGGKFSGITCEGTKDNMNCKESDGTAAAANNEAAMEYLEQLLNLETTTVGCDGTGKLIEVTHENGDVDYRYVGKCPNNYVTFNDETWRIIGIFNGRIKLIRKDSLGNYSWDTSASNVNNGFGINEWSQADLMSELNGDYLNTNLTANKTWYNGKNNKKDATFDYTKVLSDTAQNLIADATWNLGSGTSVGFLGLSASEMYKAERMNLSAKICEYGEDCNDRITRKTSWIGKVGIMYLSDYGYASSACNDGSKTLGNYNDEQCKNSNWLYSNTNEFTLIPARTINSASAVWHIYDSGLVRNADASNAYGVRPTVYLKPAVLISGNGTESNPYEFKL